MIKLLDDLPEQARVLDLGAGPGSFSYLGRPFVIAAVDSDSGNFGGCSSDRALRLCATSSLLPFRDKSFALVIAHHSLEHFADVSGTLEEIGRILADQGSLYISVPDGSGITDTLYRFLLAGGGHVNKFRREILVIEVEHRTGTRLIEWTKLYTSFNFVSKRHFVLRPRGYQVPPLPRRIRLIGQLPKMLFTAAQFFLNVCLRYMDRLLSTQYSVYGWAFTFSRKLAGITEIPGFLNVCSMCGAGHPASSLKVRLAFYCCPNCGARNPYFRPFLNTR